MRFLIRVRDRLDVTAAWDQGLYPFEGQHLGGSLGKTFEGARGETWERTWNLNKYPTTLYTCSESVKLACAQHNNDIRG